MKYKGVSVLRYEIGAGEMWKERKWIKNIPDNNWDWRKSEGKERKRGKVTMTSDLPPPRIQLGPNPRINTVTLSHTRFGTSTEQYDNFGI